MAQDKNTNGSPRLRFGVLRAARYRWRWHRFVGLYVVGVLVFLGLVSTALGLYWWNKGACLVSGGTLAVMNNLHVPVGLLLNLLIWNQHEPLGRLFIGGLVIVFAVWISRLDRRPVTV